MRERNSRAIVETAGGLRTFLSALAIFVSGALCFPAAVRAGNFASINLSVTVVDVSIPLFSFSAPFQVSAQDFMTVPIVVDGNGSQITDVSLLFRPAAPPAGAPAVGAAAPRAAVAVSTLSASDISTFQSTGTLFTSSPVGKAYFKGSAILPGSSYAALGAVEYYFSVTLKDPLSSATTTYFVGANGVPVPQQVGLAPLATVYVPRFEQPATSAGRSVVLDNDPIGTNAAVDLPAGALSGPSRIWIEQLNPKDASRVPPSGGMAPVSAYEFDGDVRRFNTPVTITLRYPDIDATPGIVDGTNIDEKSLRVFWWDGFTWRLMGGMVDVVNNTVSVKTSHFSLYGLFPSAPAATPQVYRPLEKVITPNGDGKDDFANFNGLGGSGGTFEIKIFDVTGREIRSIQNLPAQWDGKDGNGRVVENGVYIYQYRTDASSDWVSGMIGVAK